MERVLVVCAAVVLAGGCDRGGDEAGASPQAAEAPARETGETAATLRELPARGMQPDAPSPPKPPLADDVAEDGVEQEVAEGRERRRRGGGGGGGTDTRGGSDDVADGTGRDGADTQAGPCPGGDPCPNGGYLVESCVTGGMAFRDEHGRLTARRGCSTRCTPSPPQGTRGQPCAQTGCRRFRCEAYAP